MVSPSTNTSAAAEPVVFGVFGDPDVRPVEEFLEADHLRLLSLGIAGELLMLVEHRCFVPGPGRLGDRRPDRCRDVPPSGCHSF
jgi:hypothetical protein